MEKLYTTAETSEYLKVSELTIRRYIKDGKIKSNKIGRQHRISESSLKDFINGQYNSKHMEV